MVTTIYSLCNQALTLLRADTITDFTDGTNESEVCSLLYGDFTKDILTRYPWSFAMKKSSALTATTAPVNEYSKAHTYPTEALKLWALRGSSSIGQDLVIDYNLQAVGTSQVIYSNNTTLYADYTFYQAEAYWPSHFITFFTMALAAKLAIPITDKTDLADMWKKEAFGSSLENGLGGAYAIATRLDAMMNPPQSPIIAGLEAARFS